MREEIEEILVDCYGEGEQMSAWEVAFMDGVAVPVGASLLGIPALAGWGESSTGSRRFG